MPAKDATPAAPQEPRDRALRVEIAFSTLVAIVAVVGCLWLVVKLLSVVLVLIAALFLSALLSPAVEWIEGRGIRRRASIVIVFSALAITNVLLVALTIPALVDQARSLVAQEPALRARVIELLLRSPLTTPLAESLRTLRYETLPWLSGSNALALSTQIVEFLAYSLGAIFLALYILMDRDRLRGGLFALVPRRHHMLLSRVLLKLETIVGGYIRGQLITCLAIAVFMFVLLLVCGVPNALALAVFGGIADVLPYIGAMLTIIPAAIAALSVGPVITAIVVVMMLAYEEFESRVLVPIVYGRALRLPSSIVLLSLLVGVTLMGIAGALLALPVAAAILMLVEELRVDLPGASTPAAAEELRKQDGLTEELYERLTEGMPVAEAAAIAVVLSDERAEVALPTHPDAGS